MKNTSYKIAVIGTGYVGLPLALELSKYFDVLAYDKNKKRIKDLVGNIDTTGEVEYNDLKKTRCKFSFKDKDLALYNVYILTVSTPIDQYNNPDLNNLIRATKAVSKYMKNENLFILESTVYPGLTRSICKEIIERNSKLKEITYESKELKGFYLGYSPERVNPGKNNKKLTEIKKIISSSSKNGLKILEKIYGKIISAGLHKAPTIEVAESAKIIENIQRDINIALINELSIIFNNMGIDTYEVLKAAKTKWNFLDFNPGLVGGHCIGVDPYYLTYKCNEINYHPEMILSGRRTNENMPRYIFSNLIRICQKKGIVLNDNVKFLILGGSFKENCPDIRNSKVFDLIKEIKKYSNEVFIFDPLISEKLPLNVKKIETLENKKFLNFFDILIIAVPHKEILKINFNKKILSLLKNDKRVIIDLKNSFQLSENDFHF